MPLTEIKTTNSETKPLFPICFNLKLQKELQTQHYGTAPAVEGQFDHVTTTISNLN